MMKDWVDGENRLRGSKSSIKKFADHIINSLKNHSINLNSSSSILDIGCGDGAITKYIANFYKIDILDGCDISDHYFNKEDQVNIIFKAILDGGKLPYENESFDFVYSFGVVQYIKNEDLHFFYQESNRVLKKGGYCSHFNILDKSKMFEYYKKPRASIKNFLSFILFGGLRAYITNKQWKDGSLWHDPKELIINLPESTNGSLKNGCSNERSDIFFTK